MQMPSRTRTGQRGEQRAAQRLRGAGRRVKRSPGSLGPYDLAATKPRSKWQVQVKASEGLHPDWPSREEIARLIRSANSAGATPIVAQVPGRGELVFRSARNRRKMRP